MRRADCFERAHELVLVGADAGRRQPLGREQLGGERFDVLAGDGVDALDQLVDAEHGQFGEHARSEPVHACGGGLQREHEASLDVLARPRQLVLGQRLAREAGELVADHAQRLDEVLRPRPDIEADLAG
jgi:hypothetical protein